MAPQILLMFIILLFSNISCLSPDPLTHNQPLQSILSHSVYVDNHAYTDNFPTTSSN